MEANFNREGWRDGERKREEDCVILNFIESASDRRSHIQSIKGDERQSRSLLLGGGLLGSLLGWGLLGLGGLLGGLLGWGLLGDLLGGSLGGGFLSGGGSGAGHCNLFF